MQHHKDKMVLKPKIAIAPIVTKPKEVEDSNETDYESGYSVMFFEDTKRDDALFPHPRNWIPQCFNL